MGYILELAPSFQNPDYPPADIGNPNYDSQWAKNVSGGQTIPSSRFEWTSILDKNDEAGGNVGVSGWAVMPIGKTESVNTPDGDTPWFHPFGNDWKFWIAPDDAFVPLLALGNITTDPNSTYYDGDGDTARQLAEAPTGQDFQGLGPGLGLTNLAGTMELEFEKGLIASPFRTQHGDRIVAYGRWIVDSGHPNYTSEIHPPLLLAAARRAPSGTGTSATFISRAFLTSQLWAGRSFLTLFAQEVSEACFLDSIIPGAYTFTFRPEIISPPFSGKPSVPMIIRPTGSRQSLNDLVLASYHFTVRTGVTVTVEQGPDSESVQVTIAMDASVYPKAALDPGVDYSFTIPSLNKPAVDGAVAGIISTICPTTILSYAKGFVTNRLTVPPPSSPLDNQNVVTNVPVAGLPPSTTASLDDNQVYPVYGWMTLDWQYAAVNLASLTLSPDTVTAGMTATATVTLDNAFINDAITVQLLSVTPGFATVPPTVTISAGQRSAQFTVTTPQIGIPFIPARVQIVAQYGGTDLTAILTVLPSVEAGIINGLSVTPATINGGGSATGHVSLYQAVSTDTLVGLGAFDVDGSGGVPGVGGGPSTVASVPASITIPAGKTGGQFAIRTKRLGTGVQQVQHRVTIVAAAVNVKYALLTVLEAI